MYGDRKPKDLYIKIYESIKNDLETTSLERTAKQSNFTQADIKMVLQGELTENLQEKCQQIFESNTNTSFYNCLGILQDNYQYEKKLATLETKLKAEATASEIWSDGDLSNSFFDIIVDLQIIEIILFGESNYEYPFADFYDFSDTDEDNTDNKNGETPGDDTGDTPGPNPDDDQPDNNEDDSEICHDHEALDLGNIWRPKPDKKTETDLETSSQITSAIASYHGGEYNFPEADNSCTGISLMQNLLCIDPWPCNKFFCIKFDLIPQAIGNGGTEATSVQELVRIGLEQLNYLKGHTLTVHENSNERFMLSVGKFFGRPVSLDVITQGIPIKFTPNKSAFDDETEGINILGKFWNKIAEETGIQKLENGDFIDVGEEKILNMATEEGDLQTKTHANLKRNKEQLEKQLKKIKKDWKKAETTKHTQSFWEEFRTHLNIMVLYLGSIQEAFSKLETTGTEILDDTGQSCSAK